MPYALTTLNQPDGYASVPTWTPTGHSEADGGFFVRIKFMIPVVVEDSRYHYLFSNTSLSTGYVRYDSDTDTIQYRNGTSTDIWQSAAGLITRGVVHELILYREYSPVAQISISLDGPRIIASGSATFNWLASLNSIGRYSTFTGASCRVYEFELFTSGSSYSAIWDGTTAPNTGTTWLSTNGLRALTLTNFTTLDGSQWVEYGDVIAGVDSTIAASWPSLQAQAAQESAAPVYATIASVEWPSFSVSSEQSATAPHYNSAVTVSWPALAVSVSQGAESPQYSSTAAISWPSFSVAASQQQGLPAGGASVSVSWPSLNVSAAQSADVPVFNKHIALAWPIFIADASQAQVIPAGGQTISVAWPMIVVSGAQSATAPEYNLTASAAWPMFSVSALAGEFEYYAAPSATLSAPALSRRLSAPVLSRRLSAPSQSRRITL